MVVQQKSSILLCYCRQRFIYLFFQSEAIGVTPFFYLIKSNATRRTVSEAIIENAKIFTADTWWPKKKKKSVSEWNYMSFDFYRECTLISITSSNSFKWRTQYLRPKAIFSTSRCVLLFVLCQRWRRHNRRHFRSVLVFKLWRFDYSYGKNPTKKPFTGFACLVVLCTYFDDTIPSTTVFIFVDLFF